MKTIQLLGALLLLSLATTLVPFALDWRSPFLFVIRRWALVGLILAPTVMIVAQVAILRSSSPGRRVLIIVSVLGILTALFVMSCALVLEGRFLWTKQQVLSTSPEELEPVGRHIIIGYRSFFEVKRLVERRAVGGVFISSWNVRSGNANQLRDEIETLQHIRREQGLPRLWIATDQEGGVVSRLSPPLPYQPPLSQLVKKYADKAELKSAVRRYALIQGEGLAELGVNLNLAPVVDLNHNIVNPNDRFTRIYKRAISDDPEITAQVAGWYCDALEETGVRCVLKHFPGLGRVFEDTHKGGASLKASVSELMKSDWIPFRALMKHSRAFTMLGHVRLTELDNENPASVSPKVITGLIRNTWKYNGVLITDNVTMWSIYRCRLGMANACVQALNAGADLLLISYDTDQYYRIMSALLNAYRNGRLSSKILVRSEKRLARSRLRVQNRWTQY